MTNKERTFSPELNLEELNILREGNNLPPCTSEKELWSRLNFFMTEYSSDCRTLTGYHVPKWLEAEDVLSEAKLKIIKASLGLISRGEQIVFLNSRAVFLRYMNIAILSVIVDLFRKKSRTLAILDSNLEDLDCGSPLHGSPSENPEAVAIENEKIRKIEEKIGELNPQQRMILYLWLRGVVFEEIINFTGQPTTGAARMSMERIKKKLRRQLNP